MVSKAVAMSELMAVTGVPHESDLLRMFLRVCVMSVERWSLRKEVCGWQG